ncbi:MAG: hypothetical protein ACRDBO_11620 [Lachnospiraceae bacterium]
MVYPVKKIMITFLLLLFSGSMAACAQAGQNHSIEKEDGNEGGIMMTHSEQNINYDRVAQLLNADQNEQFYPAYVDYLCYLKNQYPAKVKLTEVMKAETDYQEIRIWECDDYVMKAKWSKEESSGKNVCEFEWEWKDAETEKVITDLINEGIRKFQDEQEQSESLYNSEQYATESFSVIETCIRGKVYEITENNYIEGVNKDILTTDIESLKSVLKGIYINEADVEVEKSSYLYSLNFFDEKGEKILAFFVDKDKNIWCDKRLIKNSKALLDWLDVVLDET